MPLLPVISQRYPTLITVCGGLLVPAIANQTEGLRMQDQITYTGRTTAAGRDVFVTGEDGDRVLRVGGGRLVGGHAWGRGGAVPREVSRAMLIDATGNPMLAERLCRGFTWEVIAGLPASGFEITRDAVIDWVQRSPASQPSPSFAMARPQAGWRGLSA